MERDAPGLQIGGRFAQQEQRRPAIESNEYIFKAILVHIGDAANAGVFRNGIEVFAEFQFEGSVARTGSRNGTDPGALGTHVGLAKVIGQTVAVQVAERRRFADLVIVKLHLLRHRG